jgi:hypothetical protein
MNSIDLENSEVDILISSLILLSKQDQTRLEELYNLKVNQVFDKLYSIKLKNYNINDAPCCRKDE